MSAENVASGLALAADFSAAQLKRSCLYYLRSEHSADYQSLPGFSDLPDEIKREISAFVSKTVK
jgi:hypothetical protein